MNIFVGNLVLIPDARSSYRTLAGARNCPSLLVMENNVKALFEAFGTVSSVTIKIKSGKNPRGFGFVNMPDELQAQAAIVGLQDKEFMGRPLSVSIERPKPIKPKKDYKEIKRISRLAKQETSAAVFSAPDIPEKEVKPKAYQKLEKEDKPRRKVREDAKKFSQPAGAQSWVKRKGRGTAKPWKKKPGGVNKKFKHAR